MDPQIFVLVTNYGNYGIQFCKKMRGCITKMHLSRAELVMEERCDVCQAIEQKVCQTYIYSNLKLQEALKLECAHCFRSSENDIWKYNVIRYTKN
jgi:hypothetical protein